MHELTSNRVASGGIKTARRPRKAGVSNHESGHQRTYDIQRAAQRPEMQRKAVSRRFLS